MPSTTRDSDLTALEAKLKAFVDQQDHSASTTVRSSLADGLVWVRFTAGTMRERVGVASSSSSTFCRYLPADAVGDYPVGAKHGCEHVSSVWHPARDMVIGAILPGHIGDVDWRPHHGALPFQVGEAL